MSGVKGRSGPPGNQHALTHGLFVKSSTGVRLRSRPVQRLVRQMQDMMPWLKQSDLPAVRSWAQLEYLGAKVYADLMQRGFLLESGEPRKLLSEFRQLKLAQLAYERDLGLTPATRAALAQRDDVIDVSLSAYLDHERAQRQAQQAPQPAIGAADEPEQA